MQRLEVDQGGFNEQDPTEFYGTACCQMLLRIRLGDGSAIKHMSQSLQVRPHCVQTVLCFPVAMGEPAAELRTMLMRVVLQI